MLFGRGYTRALSSQIAGYWWLSSSGKVTVTPAKAYVRGKIEDILQKEGLKTSPPPAYSSANPHPATFPAFPQADPSASHYTASYKKSESSEVDTPISITKCIGSDRFCYDYGTRVELRRSSDNVLDSYMNLPAKIYNNGTCMWYKDGNLHREGGKPAVVNEYSKREEYWIYGKRVNIYKRTSAYGPPYIF